MKIRVDTHACMRHGQCVIAAPKLFSFADDGELVWIAEPTEDLWADAEEAADVCPEQAIHLER